MEEDALADRLHSAAIHLLRWARADDPASGVTAARLSVLSVLVFGRARTVSELADAEQVAVPTMTRLLQGLAKDGYARRQRDPDDRRVVRVAATPRGRRALEAARRARLARLGRVIARIEPAERDSLAEGLEALERALHGVAAAAPTAAAPTAAAPTAAEPG